MIPLSKPNINKKDFKYIKKVLNSNILTDGFFQNKVEKIIKRLIKSKYVALTQSCTSALEISALLINLKKNDEVILPSYGFVSVANAIVLRGAKPVFVDVDEKNLNISIDDIKNKITKKTKAIYIIHYAGNSCEMKELLKIKKKHKLFLIEDVAHAPGASVAGKVCGTFGDVGCFSFFTNKNLSVGEGGMTTTKNHALGKRLASLRSHGMTSLTLDRHKGRSITYDVQEPGINYRMDEMRAALGLVQLGKLKNSNEMREQLTARYKFNLRNTNIKIPFEGMPQGHMSVFHILPVFLPAHVDRISVIEYLKERGIQSSIHYPAFWNFSAYKDVFNQEDTPVASRVIPRELTLPLYPNMTFIEVDEVCVSLIEACE